MSTGSKISAVDYNIIRNKIINVLGTGAGQTGYGQTIASTDVAVGNTVTKAQWDALRFDILNVRIHQDGITPTVAEAALGAPIRYGAGQPNSQYSTQADIAVANKFNVGTGQFVIQTAGDVTRTEGWGSSISTTVTVTFSTADQARYFFNSGGKIRFTASRSGGSSNAQNTAWSNLLNSAGVISVGAIEPTISFYSLTSTDQTIFNSVSSSPYSANNFSILGRCNVSNNAVGGATILTFTIRWTDGYSRPGGWQPDYVNGTMRLLVEQLRASGSMLPAGSFTIEPPTFSVTPIVGS